MQLLAYWLSLILLVQQPRTWRFKLPGFGAANVGVVEGYELLEFQAQGLMVEELVEGHIVRGLRAEGKERQVSCRGMPTPEYKGPLPRLQRKI